MFRIQQSGKKAMILALAVITLISALLVPEGASAQVVYSYQDQASAARLPEGSPFILGSHMVWCEVDGNQNQQIFYQNIRTEEKKQITDVPSLKSSPQVGVTSAGEVYLVWRDRRNFASEQGAWDIYAYELAADREWKLNSANSMYDYLSVEGSDVVWYDLFTREIMHVDLKQGREASIGRGRAPAVAEGKVVYINPDDGGLSLYSLASGERRALLVLPYHLNVINVAFNGSHVLYKQANLDSETKYAMLNVLETDAKPVDLTPAVKRTTEYYQLYMGDQQAAWIQDDNGSPVLMGVNLQKAETFALGYGDEAMRTLAFDQDRLMLESSEGRIMYRQIIRTEVSPGPDYSEHSGYSGYAGALGGSDAVKGNIGSKGGVLEAKDGMVKLSIPAGAADRDTEVELKPHSQLSEAMSLAAAKPKLTASKVWDVSVDTGLLDHAQLTFVYDAEKWTALQSQKMVICRWDESAKEWMQVGGRHDSQTRSITADMKMSGTYALFVNDIAFGDSIGHWARAYIEVLASRDIVSGMDEGQFYPETVLTRAQFTKMLLGALGIRQSASKASVFADVPSTHWSADWVNAAAAAGLVQGDGGRFNPDAELTREEMMAMLVRAIGKEEKALSLGEEEINRRLTYRDSDQFSAWAKGYAAVASQSGLIEGDNSGIHPQQSSNRAQAAAVVYRLLQQLKKI